MLESINDIDIYIFFFLNNSAKAVTEVQITLTAVNNNHSSSNRWDMAAAAAVTGHNKDIHNPIRVTRVTSNQITLKQA